MAHYQLVIDLYWKYSSMEKKECICRNCFKQISTFFPNIIRYIFNVLKKIFEEFNAHVMYSPLVCSNVSYGLIKITELSCTFSMILWIQNKKIFVFNYKKHKWNDILTKHNAS
jgi:hypothetical protein